MTYQARFANPLIQFGFAEFTLLLDDDSGQLPSYRIPVRFPDTVTEAELTLKANAVVAQILAEQAVEIPQEVVPQIDLPVGD